MLPDGNIFNDARLVFFTHITEKHNGLITWHDRSRHRIIAFGDLAHPFLDLIKVILGESTFESEVVVEAVFNHWTNGHLGFRKQFFDGLRQQVRGGMPDDINAFRVAIGNDGYFGILLDEIGSINQLAVDASGQRGAREARPDTCGNFSNGDRLGILSKAAIGQRDDRHGA